MATFERTSNFEVPVTGGKVPLRIDRTASNLIEAAANGTTDGLKLWLNVIAMLVAFIALVNLVDWPLGYVGEAWFGMPEGGTPGSLDLNLIFGQLFAPVAWIMGKGDMAEIDSGRMDPEGRGLTQAGMICGIIGLSLFALVVLLFVVMIALGNL